MSGFEIQRLVGALILLVIVLVLILRRSRVDLGLDEETRAREIYQESHPRIAAYKEFAKRETKTSVRASRYTAKQGESMRFDRDDDDPLGPAQGVLSGIGAGLLLLSILFLMVG